jgi:L-phenylalanine/L-methionine N-acetyltransferase
MPSSLQKKSEEEFQNFGASRAASGASLLEFAADQACVRRRRASDDAALMELFNEQIFIDMALTRGAFVTLEEFQSWLKGLAKTRFEIVYEHADDVVGYGALFCMDDRLSHCGWICLGVRENFQHRGIGACLMNTLMVTAELIAGLRRVQLTVFADNDGALKLYQKFGFEIEGLHRCFVRRGSAFVDAVTMARLLAEPRAALSRSEMLRRIQELRNLWAPSRLG